MDAKRAEFRRKFRALDTDGNGALSYEELRSLLLKGDPSMSEKEISSLFHSVDTDGSGFVEFEEFLDYIFSASAPAPPEWFQAASDGDIQALERFVKNGVNVNARDSFRQSFHPCCGGFTALMVASFAGHEECVQFLAQAGGKLNCKDTVLGMTAAMLAAEAGHASTVALLGELRADLDLKDNSGATAAMHAASAGLLPTLRILAKNRVDLSEQDHRGWTAAMMAVRFGHEDCLKLLIDKEADVNQQNKLGQSALMLAVLACDELCVKLLIDKDANVHEKDFQGNTACSLAAVNKHQTCLHILHKAVGSPQFAGTLLSRKGSPALGTSLLSRKGSPRKGSPSPRTRAPVAMASDAWSKAAWACDVYKLGDMLDSGADIEAQDVYGWTAVMIAVIRDDNYCLEFLISSKAGLNTRDLSGWTAVMLAAKKGHSGALQILATQGADLNVQTDDGESALTFAAQAGCKACLRILTRNGVPVDTTHTGHASPALTYLLTTGELFIPKKTSTQADEADEAAGRQETAGSPVSQQGGAAAPEMWFRAALYRRADVLMDLLEEGAYLDVFGNQGMTALMIAAENGDEDAVRLLVKRNACVDFRDRHFGKTALCFAAAEGHVGCMRVLINDGEATVSERDNQRRTALMQAAFHGHEQCVRFLARRGASLDSKDAEGQTPALIAATRGHVGCLKVLAEQGADLLVKGSNGAIRNSLHKLETVLSFEDAASCVAMVDWTRAIAGGPDGMVKALTDADSIAHQYHVAGLHFSLWDEDPTWGNLKVRDEEFCESLLGCVVEFLERSKNRSLTNVSKKALSLALEAGIVKAINAEDRAALKEMNSEVLEVLEQALETRQKELGLVSAMTPEPDVYFKRWNRDQKKVAGKLDQRDSVPAPAWHWIEELPNDCFERLESAYKAFSGIAILHSEQAFATYLRDYDFLVDSALYARASAHILVGWAKMVLPFFEDFMAEHFGDLFHAAPNKKLPRMYTKLAGDYPELEDDTRTAEDAKLRMSYCQLGDLVRGALTADGPQATVDMVEHLQNLTTMGRYGKFEVWRIKNTHHSDAQDLVGGYRDVKVLGNFTAKRQRLGFTVSMIVEIQVIDAVFTDVKKYMHKAYAIDRGDFD